MMDAKTLPDDIKAMLRNIAKRNELLLIGDEDPVYYALCEAYLAGVYG